MSWKDKLTLILFSITLLANLYFFYFVSFPFFFNFVYKYILDFIVSFFELSSENFPIMGNRIYFGYTGKFFVRFSAFLFLVNTF